MSNFKELSDSFASRFISLVKLSQFETPLREVCEYALFPPGKCFRAGLALYAGKLLGVQEVVVLPWACAVEVLHAATLVHDDLPALDDDALRRGRESVHCKFGQAQAVLAGDALLLLASQLLTEAACAVKNEDSSLVYSYLLLSGQLQRSAIAVCEGQLLDIQSNHSTQSTPALSEQNSEALARRHQLKTGSLIQAAVVGPSYFLTPQEHEVKAAQLQSYGENLGMLFQITDDLLEATSSAEILGKNVDSDSKKGISTYVTLYGLSGARQLAEDAAERAKSAIQDDQELAALTEVVELVLYRLQ